MPGLPATVELSFEQSDEENKKIQRYGQVALKKSFFFLTALRIVPCRKPADGRFMKSSFVLFHMYY